MPSRCHRRASTCRQCSARPFSAGRPAPALAPPVPIGAPQIPKSIGGKLRHRSGTCSRTARKLRRNPASPAAQVLAAPWLSGAQGARIDVAKSGRKPAHFAHLRARTFRNYSACAGADLADFRPCGICETAPGLHQREERGAALQEQRPGAAWGPGMGSWRPPCAACPPSARLPVRCPPVALGVGAATSASGSPAQVYGLAPVTGSACSGSARYIWTFPQHQRRAPPRFRIAPVNLTGPARPQRHARTAAPAAGTGNGTSGPGTACGAAPLPMRNSRAAADGRGGVCRARRARSFSAFSAVHLPPG